MRNMGVLELFILYYYIVLNCFLHALYRCHLDMTQEHE